MGRLSGFTYTETVRRLSIFGFRFDRQAKGGHEIWINESTHRWTTVPHHSKPIVEGTLSAILHEAGISRKDFLRAS